ncbi:hypothetical protein WA588_002797, partial [Blastocystis sp. NMH]
VSVLRRVSLPLTQEGLVEIKHRYFYIHELQAFHQYGVLLEKRLFTFQLIVSCILSAFSYCYFNVYYWIFSLCIVFGSVIMRLSVYLKHPRFFWIVPFSVRWHQVLCWYYDCILRVLVHLLSHRVWSSTQTTHPSPPPSLYVYVQLGRSRKFSPAAL